MSKTVTFEDAIEMPHAHIVLSQKGLMNPRTGDILEEGIAKLTSEQKNMLAFAIQHWNEHIVCNYLQLNVPAGRLPGGNAKDKDFNRNSVLKTILPHAPIETAEYLKINWDYKNNGRWYEFLEKETEEYQNALAENIKTRKLNAIKAQQAKESLTSGLATLAEEAARKASEKEKPTTAKTSKTYVVTIDNVVEEYVGDPAEFNEKDYLFTGSKKQCDDFAKNNK